MCKSNRFEQDERGKHRVVTVRTVGTSDDNNHEVIEQDNIYYKPQIRNL